MESPPCSQAEEAGAQTRREVVHTRAHATDLPIHHGGIAEGEEGMNLLDKTLNREELAWAAGFFDGEGNIRSHTKFCLPIISIAQVDRRVLDRFREVVGNLGVVLGPYQHKHPHKEWKQVYRYNVAKFEYCQAIVVYLWNWLSPVKREQAQRVLSGYRNFIKQFPSAVRGQNCIRNHDLSNPLNVHIYQGIRVCRICRKIQYRERAARKRRAVA